MADPESTLVPAVSMDDEVGIVYLIETAQQFWSGELYPGSLCPVYSLKHYLRIGGCSQASQ